MPRCVPLRSGKYCSMNIYRIVSYSLTLIYYVSITKLRQSKNNIFNLMFIVGGLMRRKKQADTTQLSVHMIIEFLMRLMERVDMGVKVTLFFMSRIIVRKIQFVKMEM